MNSRKRTKRISMIIFGILLCSLLGGVLVVSASPRIGAGKKGTYCSVVGSYAYSSSNSLTVCVRGQNYTSSTKYMSVSAQVYNAEGKLIGSKNNSGNIVAGGTISTDLSNMSSGGAIYGQTIIYRGTSASAGILESVRIIIN